MDAKWLWAEQVIMGQRGRMEAGRGESWSMRKTRLLVWLGLVCVAAHTFGVHTHTQAQTPTGGKCRPQWRSKFKVRFEQKSLLDTVKWISKRTCYNFILSSQVRGQRISLIAEKPVGLSELYRAFLAALAVSDVAIVKKGKFRRLIYARNARRQAIPTYTGKRFPHSRRSEVVTYLLRPKFININTVSNVIRQLASARALTLPVYSSGVLILIDYAVNIHRLLKIIKELDVAEAGGRDKMFLVQVENGQAQDLVQKVSAIFHIMDRSRARAQRLRGQPIDESHRISKILADERTNRLILVCSQKAYMNAVGLIRKLDLPLAEGGLVRVHRLSYAKADEITQTLSQLTRAGARRARIRRSSKRKTRAPSTPQTTDLFSGEVRISPDKETNSLIIVASQRDYENLMKVIRRLDIRRKQVFVEAVILEVSVDKTRDLGAAFHGGAPVDSDPNNPSFALFGTSLSGLNSLVLDPAALMGLSLGLRGPDIAGTSGLFGGSTGIPSFGVILRAIQTNSDVDIISTPHILTTTNEEATIQVGQNVPFIAGTSFSAAGLGVSFPVRNIQRQDVALTMRIKPQINAGDNVKLELDMELTEIAAQNPELGPTTTKRKVKTTVRVRDNQTVVVGGLMRDRISEGVAKVPFLGDIPLLGGLFRVKNRTMEKRNLLIFLTPHIILQASDFQRIFKKKMNERRKFLKMFYDNKARQDFINARLPGSRRGLVDILLEGVSDMDKFNKAVKKAQSAPKPAPTAPKAPTPSEPPAPPTAQP